MKQEIRRVHTLGPAGTNCEKAAAEWIRRNDLDCDIVLHTTLEEAVEAAVAAPNPAALIACVVYPNLHQIVFQNLGRLEIHECFVCNTHKMMLAARKGVTQIRTVACHPAARDLVPYADCEIRLANSNVVAADLCAQGRVDACITTETGVRTFQLEKVIDFGPVAMGFSVHTPLALHAEARPGASLESR